MKFIIKKKQAIILAGGYSKRMGKLTSSKHKCMLKIGKFPIIAHLYTQLRLNYFSEIFISTGFKSKIISTYCKKKIKHDSNKILKEAKIKNLLFYPKLFISKLQPYSSTTERVVKIKNKLNKFFFLIYGDTLLKPKINDLYKLFKKNNSSMVITVSKPTPRFGMIKIKGSKVIKFNEKDLNNEPLVNSGWMLIDKKILNKFKRKKMNFESYIFKDLKNLKVYAVKNSKFYLPIDNQNDLSKANLCWKNNKKLWL